jgi:hypothetical protein
VDEGSKPHEDAENMDTEAIEAVAAAAPIGDLNEKKIEIQP